MRTIESEAVNHPDFATLWIVPVFVIVESDLSPIAAEYGSISACSTQNKAKRANKIVFLLLIRDQQHTDKGNCDASAQTKFDHRANSSNGEVAVFSVHACGEKM